MGYVVIAALFEPGTEVKLFRVSDEALRVDGYEELAGDRLADGNGSVGFDGLEGGARYVARGFDGTMPVEVTVRGQSEGDVAEVSQPPIVATPQPVGTQEVVPPVEAPAEPASILQVGVPAGLPAGQAS